ncbi:MAG: hypothetical protein D6722_18475 [Bacteroidetes bacterium]|nr:MAG: hypothetical protein D6722_18475 [Bacteroidota bacterium]
MRAFALCIGLITLWVNLLLGQKFPEKGLPPLNNYAPIEYAQAGKVWAIQSAPNGLVYFAADKGLLEFDGLNWRRRPGSKGFTRSLLVVNDSVIYTGADKDFGVWRRTGLGDFQYASLYPFRESAKGLNEEFWGVYSLEREIVFVSFDNIYVLKGGQLTKIAAPSRFSKSFQVDGAIYLADEKTGLCHFDGLSLNQVFGYPDPQPWQIMGVDQTEDGLLILTRSRGLWRYQEARLQPVPWLVSQYLQRDQVFSFAPIEQDHYAIGTILNGVYITDRQGQIIQHLNKPKGLLNNTILSLHYSPQGSLWLGMDFGVAKVFLSSQIAYILDHQGEFGTGQTALLDQRDFYLGTNQGLYFANWDSLKNNASGISFSLIPGSAGQVWALQDIRGDIWCGHDRGLFRVSRRGLIPIYTEEGVLAMTPLDDQHLVAGTYNGLSLFQLKGGRWTFERKIAPVQGACNQVIADGEDLLWINVPNFGLIKASMSPDFRIEAQRIYLDRVFEGENPWISLDSTGLHVRTSQQAYVYDASQDSFLRADSLPGLKAIVNRLPFIWEGLPISDTFQFFPVYNGFALYNQASQASSPPPASLVVRSLTAFNNDTTESFDPPAAIPYHLNNIRVQYLVPHQADMRYRHRLVNFQDKWSEWSSQQHLDFINLPEGDYQLLIEAQSPAGVLRAQPLQISILPPWYRQWYTYLGFVLLALALYGLMRWRHQRKLERMEARLQASERQARAKQAEADQQAKMLQNQERLESEIVDLKKRLRAKTIELAKKGKENEDKNRLLQTLRDTIADIEKRSSVSNRHWAEMSRLLDNQTRNEDNTFEVQIDELNQDFLRRLKARYPALTTYDLRLAIYLKMGLSSREIAELLNVLPSSVNVSRSRLRRKLNLDADQDLYEFLIEV